MANISFGQNILPKTDNTYSLGNSSYKWHAYLADINGQAIEDLVLPAVTSSDNDKILKVSSGEWTVGDAPSGLPTVSSTDNGKILSVSSGEWVAITPSYLTSHQDISGKANIADLATVATSGSYNDLLNKPTIPTIPTNVSSFTNDAGYLTSHQDISGKANSVDLATVATSGSYTDLLNKPDLSVYLTSVPTMVGATSSAAGTAGLVPAPTSADVDKFLAGDGTYKSGGLPMVVLSYGSSTWADFEAAYNNNVIVYCRASSNANPASGSQTRMAFMAYVNNATTPTEVEFQYYRSMSAHSATAMGDQVFVYKLTKTGGWSVTSRDASIKEINVATGSKLGVSWSSNKVTLSNTMTAVDMPMSSSDATTVDSAISTLSEQIGNINTALNGNSMRFEGTLTGNVITVANNCPIGLSFYKNSNNPTNCPSAIAYGAYLFLKAAEDNVAIFCWNNSSFSCVYSVNPKTATSISWNTIK